MEYENREHKINFLRKKNRDIVAWTITNQRKMIANQEEIIRLIKEVEFSGNYKKEEK